MLQLVSEVQEVGVEVLEFLHFAVLLDELFGDLGYLGAYLLAEQGLGRLDVLYAALFQHFLELGELLPHSHKVFVVLLLSYTKDHIKCFFGVFLGYFE